jgi:non-ribosomal peptide synthetase component F
MTNSLVNGILPQEQQAIRTRCLHRAGSFIEFKFDDVEQSIAYLFERATEQFADRIAVKTRLHTLTFDGLNRAANRIAHAILNRTDLGKKPVGLLFDNDAPFIMASLGALKAGRIQVPLESGFPRARLEYVLRQSQVALLLTDGANLPWRVS